MQSPLPLPQMLRPHLATPLETAMESFVRARTLAGAYARVIHRDGASYSCRVGAADPTRAVPFEADTLVRLHSMSKPLTVAAFMTLVDGGLITLDTPLAAILPEFGMVRVARAGRGSFISPKPITVAHLLTHTSGLAYADAHGSRAERSMADVTRENSGPVVAASLAEWTVWVARAELAHVPGEAWHYGVGIDVLGRVAEVITGKPLDVVLSERLFQPLGMADTSFGMRVELAPRAAPILHRSAGQFVPIEARDEAPPAVLSGGGGIVSTAADYASFLQMLLNEGRAEGAPVLASASVREIMRDHVGQPGRGLRRAGRVGVGPGCGFGLGGRVVLDPRVAGYGSPGTYGWDGIAGTTFFADATSGVAALLVTQIVPWPAGLHEAFRSTAAQSLTRS